MTILSYLVDVLVDTADGEAAFEGNFDEAMAGALEAIREVVTAPSVTPCSMFADWAPTQDVHEVMRESTRMGAASDEGETVCGAVTPAVR